MKLNDYVIEELESMSYPEITEIILKESNKKMKIIEIYKKICEVLHKSNAEFEEHVADFFEIISTDSRFIILDQGFCDLKINHNPTILSHDEFEDDEDEHDEIVEESEELEDIENNIDDDIYYDNSSDEDDITDVDADLEEFMVIEEEDEANI